MRRCAVVLAVAFFVALPLSAAKEKSNIPIDQAFIDCGAATLILVGLDLGDPTAAILEIGGIPVAVDLGSSTSQMIVADLSALCPLDPGTYDVTLESGNDFGDIDTTFGTQGLQGPAGPEGAQGPMGPPGLGDGHSLDAVDGSPTDAVFVDSDGNVGIGTTSPGALLDIVGPEFLVPLRVQSSPTGFPNTQQWLNNSGGVGAAIENTGAFYTGSCGAIGNSTTCSNGQLFVRNGTPARVVLRVDGSSGGNTADLLQLFSDAGNTRVFTVDSSGNVGVGIATPSNKLHVVGDIFATGTITQGSSRQLKESVSPLSGGDAFSVLRSLQPVSYRYIADDSGDLQLGFIAEDVPELVSVPERNAIPPLDLIAVLTKVIQEQERTISSLGDRVAALESRRH